MAASNSARNGNRTRGARRMSADESPGQAVIPASLRGRVRLALIRDLAMGEWSHAEIAKQTGATTKEIAAFAREHEAEIAEVSAALAGRLAVETAGLWISKKQNRVAELQKAYDDNDAVIDEMRASEQAANSLGSRKHFNLQRLQLSILGAAAAEYESRRGQSASSDDGKVVRYIIEGPEAEYLT